MGHKRPTVLVTSYFTCLVRPGLFRHHTFGNYFATRSKIVSATSMARKGWFMDLSISQKKVRERAKSNSSSSEDKAREIGISAFALKPIMMSQTAKLIRKVFDEIKN